MFYSWWRLRLAESIDFQVAQYPAREQRRGDALPSSLSELVADSFDQFADVVAMKPFAIQSTPRAGLGSSMALLNSTTSTVDTSS